MLTCTRARAEASGVGGQAASPSPRPDGGGLGPPRALLTLLPRLSRRLVCVHFHPSKQCFTRQGRNLYFCWMTSCHLTSDSLCSVRLTEVLGFTGILFLTPVLEMSQRIHVHQFKKGLRLVDVLMR